MKINETFVNEPKNMAEEYPDSESEIINNDELINKAAERIQELFIKSAEQYLDKENDKYLREQIIKFYSDRNRLSSELSNVFSGMKENEVYKKIAETSKSLGTREDFLQYVETKNFATSQEERAVEEARIRNVYKFQDEKQLEAIRGGNRGGEEVRPIWKGTEFWTNEIEVAGVIKKLKFFNDIITEKRPPHKESGYGQPVLTDIILDGKKVDIYHSDQNDKDTTHRLYLYIKE